MTPDCRVAIRIMISDLHSIAGRCETALDYLRCAVDDIEEEPRMKDAYQLKIAFRIGWNLLFAGRYGEAAKFIESLEGTSIHLIVRTQGTVTVLRGLADLMQSRVSSSVGELTEAITELRLRDPARLLSMGLHLQQWAMGRLSAGAMTHSDAERRRTVAATGPAVNGWAVNSPAEHLLTRVVATAVGAGTAEGVVVDSPLMERELMLQESAQLADWELAAHSAQQRLKGLVPVQEGSRPKLIARLVELRETTNLDALEELGREAVYRGEYQIGLEALTRVALRWFAAGEKRVCGAILRQLSHIVSEQKLDTGLFVTRALALTELSSREKEIVDLARTGKNNDEIARALTVSQRTVEGHLYRIFSKLGISKRAELNSID